MDSADEIMPAMLNYLGLNPRSLELKDYKVAEKKLAPLRPYISYFHSSKYVTDLANGDICIAFGYSGDVFQAINRAKEAGNGVNVAYIVPKEGGNLWFDMLSIPADAKNPQQAHAFINYLLKPEVISNISEYVGYANANTQATALMSDEITHNPSIYPPESVQAKLYVSSELPPELMRWMTRSWNKFKSGR